MSVQWMTYKGKRILYIDYRGLTGERLRETMHASIEASVAEPEGVISLANVEGVATNAELMAFAKDEIKPAAAGKKFTKQAVVIGTQGLSTFVKKTFVNAFITVTGIQVRVFGTEEEAKEWLIS